MEIMLFFFPTFAELGPILTLVLTILGALVVWKSGLAEKLTSGQKDLLSLKEAELTHSKAKTAELSARIKELEEYNRLLILNARTTMEVFNEIKESKSHKKVKQDE
jgi:hypothetical protein